MKPLFRNLIFPILLLIIFAFVYSGCKKKDNTLTISGTIFDPMHNYNLAGATVTIASAKIEGGNYNPNYLDIESISTDGNGYFSFEINEVQVIGYRITIFKEYYFETSTDFSPDLIGSDNSYSANYNLNPKGYIKVHVKNSNPHDASDIITFKFTQGYLNGYQCCGNEPAIGYGKYFDTTFVCKTHGNQDVNFQWTVHKNGNTTTDNATFFCYPFDTAYYDVYY